MKAVIFIHVLYLILIRTFMVKGVTKCESKIELRAVLLSCPVRDSGCDDDDPLSQAMNAEEPQIPQSNSRSFQTEKEEREKGFPNSVKDCKRKLIITIKMKNVGKIPCDDEYIIVDHVFDPVTGGKARLLSPVILKLRQEQMIQLYGLQFQRVVNSDPYEEQKEPEKKTCSVGPENPTCGTALYDGRPIPFSEGFCCSRDPSVNAKRQRSPVTHGYSFLYRDSKPMFNDASRSIREEKCPTIVNPELVKMKPGKNAGEGGDEEAKEDYPLKDLASGKIPNYMMEQDRKIICDRENFLNELCHMREEKQKEGTEDLLKSGLEAKVVGSYLENVVKISAKDGGGRRGVPANGRPDHTTIPSDAHLTEAERPSQNEIGLEGLLGALNSKQMMGLGMPPNKKLSSAYPQLNSNRVVRGKRENRQEPLMSWAGKKLTLEEKLERFAKSRKNWSGRRKRLLELSHKRFRKAGIRCRDTVGCQPVAVTDLPEDDYVRSPPPKYFFSHDKFIVNPMEPSELISNSTCRSLGDVDYEESVTEDRQKQQSFKNEEEKEFREEKENSDDSLKSNTRFQKIDSKVRSKEKFQKESIKKDRVTHNTGGRIDNNMLKGKIKVEELQRPQMEKNSLRGGKRFNAEVEDEEGEYRGVKEIDKENRGQSKSKEHLEEEEGDNCDMKSHKPKKIRFSSTNIKNLFKSDNRRVPKTKIRNFIMGKSREKQKFKSEFVKSHKKQEVWARGDGEKTKVKDKLNKNGFEESPTEYHNQEPSEERQSNEEEEQEMFMNTSKNGEEMIQGPPGGAEKNTEIQTRGQGRENKGEGRAELGGEGVEEEEGEKRKCPKLLQEAKQRDNQNGGVFVGGRKGENLKTVDFSVEIIRKNFPEEQDHHFFPSKEEQFLRNRVAGATNIKESKTCVENEMNRKMEHLSKQKPILYYKPAQNYYVLQKNRLNYPENVYFVQESTSSAPEVKGHQFYLKEPGNEANRVFQVKRTDPRDRQSHESQYQGKPTRHYYVPVVDYSRRSPERYTKRFRQGFLSVNDNSKLYKTQYQGNSQPEIFVRKISDFPRKSGVRAEEQLEREGKEVQNLRGSTVEKIRRKRALGYSFEPARGFLGSELEFLDGKDQRKPVDGFVVHPLENRLLEGKRRMGMESGNWVGKIPSWQFASIKAENSSVSAEKAGKLQKHEEQLRKLGESFAKRERGGEVTRDKERLLRSYLNAPDYVLEEMEAGLKGKREASDQGKEDFSRGSSGCEKDTFAGEYAQDSAHCLRFGDLWYSVYMIKKPVIAQIVGVQLFDKHSLCDGTTQWRDLTKGKMVRVGTFLPKAEDDLPSISMTFMGGKTKKLRSAIDPDNYMLLIPSHVSDPSKAGFYPQFDGGPAEYLLVESKDISSGAECNMVGTSFEAFVRQPDRCSQRRGSCLKRQPVDLWREDMEARIRGKRGKYFVENFGTIPNSAIKTYTNLSGEYLALEYYGEYTSTIEIEVKADYNAIVRKGSNAQIPTVFIDGTYPKKTRIILSVLNIGLTSSYFRPRLGDCPPDLDPAWCPLEGPLVNIPPQQRHDFKLDLSGVLPPNKIHVTVQVLNQLNNKIAYRKILIKKGDRCVCAFHCKCNCIGNLIDGRACHKLSLEEYRGAGYVGSFPFRGGGGGSPSESVLGNFHMVILTATYVLLCLGAGKAILGMFCRRVGIAGTRVIMGPRNLRRYYEGELQCCAVNFDECGFPIHPTTCQPVQIVPLWVEFVLNVFFFFLYPLRAIGFLLLALPCCSAMCGDCDVCGQEDEGFDQKCSHPLLSKTHHPACASYNLTTINSKKVKADEYLPYLPYKGDDDPLEDDDTEFVLQEMKRYRQK